MKTSTLCRFLGLASLLMIPATATANQDPVCGVNPANMDSYNHYCTTTPENYEVIIYELGLCTSDPLPGTVFSSSSCQKVFESSGNTRVNLSPGSAFDLVGSSTAPAAGSYTHAYVVMDPTFKLKFSYVLNGVTYYSKSGNYEASDYATNATTVSSEASSFIETLDSFDDKNNPHLAKVDAVPVSGGVIKALLAGNNLQASTSSAGTTRLVGVFKPSSAWSIQSGLKTFDIKFTVKDTGGAVESCAPSEFGSGSSSEVCGFGSGPFAPQFGFGY